LWILHILVAAMFLFSGGMKLVGAQPRWRPGPRQ
jgi:hypothetical protein